MNELPFDAAWPKTDRKPVDFWLVAESWPRPLGIPTSGIVVEIFSEILGKEASEERVRSKARDVHHVVLGVS